MGQATITSLAFDGDRYIVNGWCYDKKQQALADGFALRYGEKADALKFERSERIDFAEKMGEHARMAGFRLQLTAAQAAAVFLGKSVKLVNSIGNEEYLARYSVPGIKFDDAKSELNQMVRDTDALLNNISRRDVLFSLCNLMLVDFNPNDKKTAVALLAGAALLFGLRYERLTDTSLLYLFLLEHLPMYLLEKPNVVGVREYALLLNTALALNIDGAFDVCNKVLATTATSSNVLDNWLHSVIFLQLNSLIFVGKSEQNVTRQFNHYLEQLKTVAHNIPSFSDEEVDDYSASCQMAHAAYLVFHVNAGSLDLSALVSEFPGLERRIYLASKGCCVISMVRSRF